MTTKNKKPDSVQESPGKENSPEAISTKDEYRKMRWDLMKLRQDNKWWRGVLSDPRMKRLLETFEKRINSQIRCLRNCAKNELEIMQQNIRDDEVFLALMKQVRLAHDLANSEEDVKRFENDNGLFLQSIVNQTDAELFEGVEGADIENDKTAKSA